MRSGNSLLRVRATQEPSAGMFWEGSRDCPEDKKACELEARLLSVYSLPRINPILSHSEAL